MTATACGQAACIPGGPIDASAQPGTSTGAARVTDRQQVVQVLDFHPDHIALIENTITECADRQNWPLDLTDLAGFLGSTDIYQKLQAIWISFHNVIAPRWGDCGGLRNYAVQIQDPISRRSFLLAV